MDKLVSVIIPSFNQTSELKNAVESVKNQSYSQLEIIIVDDCSTQNVEEVIENINDSRIQFYKTETNSGVTEARKLGIVNSTASYITFLDQDDVFNLKCIENKMNKFFENDNINLVISDYLENNQIKNCSKIHPGTIRDHLGQARCNRLSHCSNHQKFRQDRSQWNRRWQTRVTFSAGALS